MQPLSNYLYDQTIPVQINMDDPRLSTRNRIVYSKNVKLYKGIDNTLKLNFYNSDQKLTSIRDKTVVVNILNQVDHSVYITRTALISSTDAGLATVTITDIDLLALPAGFYNWSVAVVEANGVAHVAYNGDNYDAGGAIQIIDNVYPKFVGPVKFTVNSGNTTTSYAQSNMRLSNAPSIHTAQFYFNTFTGDIVIQGTLDELPDLNLGSWFDIQTVPFNLQSMNSYAAWTGIYSAIRFKVVGSAGTVTTILYRA